MDGVAADSRPMPLFSENINKGCSTAQLTARPADVVKPGSQAIPERKGVALNRRRPQPASPSTG
eukprot:177278-Chlamydomonas_euryale.AAC.2